MTQEEFDLMISDEEKRLGVGSIDFRKCHAEIMSLIEQAERSDSMKQYIDAAEISETLGVSLTKSYAIIRELNEELNNKGFITVRGKTSRAYFNERWYSGQKVS